MNIEEIVTQPITQGSPGPCPAPIHANLPKLDEPTEVWIAERACREPTERIWPRVFPGL